MRKRVRMIDILEEVKGAKSIAVGGHIRPDGDCIGSCMAMYLYLKKHRIINLSFSEKP